MLTNIQLYILYFWYDSVHVHWQWELFLIAYVRTYISALMFECILCPVLIVLCKYLLECWQTVIYYVFVYTDDNKAQDSTAELMLKIKSMHDV